MGLLGGREPILRAWTLREQASGVGCCWLPGQRTPFLHRASVSLPAELACRWKTPVGKAHIQSLLPPPRCFGIFRTFLFRSLLVAAMWTNRQGADKRGEGPGCCPGHRVCAWAGRPVGKVGATCARQGLCSLLHRVPATLQCSHVPTAPCSSGAGLGQDVSWGPEGQGDG